MIITGGALAAYTWRTCGRDELAREELFESVSLIVVVVVVESDGGCGGRLWRIKWTMR